MNRPLDGHPRELISALLDGALDAAERSAVEQHLAKCSACRALHEDLSAIVAAQRNEATPPPPVGLVERIATCISAQSRTHRPAFRAARWARPAPLAAAAAIVAAAAVGVLLQRELWRARDVTPSAEQAGAPHETVPPAADQVAPPAKSARSAAQPSATLRGLKPRERADSRAIAPTSKEQRAPTGAGPILGIAAPEAGRSLDAGSAAPAQSAVTKSAGGWQAGDGTPAVPGNEAHAVAKSEHAARPLGEVAPGSPAPQPSSLTWETADVDSAARALAVCVAGLGGRTERLAFAERPGAVRLGLWTPPDKMDALAAWLAERGVVWTPTSRSWTEAPAAFLLQVEIRPPD